MNYHYPIPPNLPRYDKPAQAALIADYRAGSLDAGGRLVESQLPNVVDTAIRYAKLLTLPESMFHDTVHEGVVACYEALNHFDQSFNVQFWSYAKRWVKPAVRRSCVSPWWIALTMADPAETPYPEVPEPAASARIEWPDRIRAGIDALDAELRAVVELHFYQGLPATTVAKMHGHRWRWAAIRIDRALAILRDYLEGDHP